MAIPKEHSGPLQFRREFPKILFGKTNLEAPVANSSRPQIQSFSLSRGTDEREIIVDLWGPNPQPGEPYREFTVEALSPAETCAGLLVRLLGFGVIPVSGQDLRDLPSILNGEMGVALDIQLRPLRGTHLHHGAKTAWPSEVLTDFEDFLDVVRFVFAILRMRGYIGGVTPVNYPDQNSASALPRTIAASWGYTQVNGVSMMVERSVVRWYDAANPRDLLTSVEEATTAGLWFNDNPRK